MIHPPPSPPTLSLDPVKKGEGNPFVEVLPDPRERRMENNKIRLHLASLLILISFPSFSVMTRLPQLEKRNIHEHSGCCSTLKMVNDNIKM